jgi:hypothetical protein
MRWTCCFLADAHLAQEAPDLLQKPTDMVRAALGEHGCDVVVAAAAAMMGAAFGVVQRMAAAVVGRAKELRRLANLGEAGSMRAGLYLRHRGWEGLHR